MEKQADKVGQAMRVAFEKELEQLAGRAWGDTATFTATPEPELTLDGLLETVRTLRTSFPRIYYAMSQFIARIDTIFKVDGSLCENGRTHWLIHPENEAYFVDAARKNAMRPFRVEVGDVFRVLRFGWWGRQLGDRSHARFRRPKSGIEKAGS